jgi:tRNA pseudouridine38-40 synthase
MLRNIKLTVEYDGTNYSGWQRQRNKLTIQGVIEDLLEKILQEKVRLIGAGRTDRRCHAKGLVANFKTNSRLDEKDIQKALNSLLPKDISVTKIREVPLDFHSRYNAKSKIYRYTILNSPYRRPLFERYSYFFPYKLDVELMREEAKCLVGKHDFKSFKNSDGREKDSIRTIKKFKISKKGNFIYFDIEADGFLRGMVRNIVGTLLEIGRGRFKRGDLRRILEEKDRRKAGPAVPAKGLCLLKVKYS